MDAKNLSKVAAERDAMAAKLLEWERKWAELEKQQQQQQQSIAPATLNDAALAATPAQRIAQTTPAATPTTPSTPVAPVFVQVVPEDYELLKAELERTKRELEEARLAKEKEKEAAGAATAAASVATTITLIKRTNERVSSPEVLRNSGSSAEKGSPQDGTTTQSPYASSPDSAAAATRAPAARKGSVPLVVAPDAALRDLKVSEKLRTTEKELLAYKEKISKLEEENKSLLVGKYASAPLSSTVREVPVGQSGHSAQNSESGPTKPDVVVQYDEDSDDSDGDAAIDVDLEDDIKMLDNRHSDWQAYMESFHIDPEAEKRRLSMHQEIEYDSDGNEIPGQQLLHHSLAEAVASARETSPASRRESGSGSSDFDDSDDSEAVARHAARHTHRWSSDESDDSDAEAVPLHVSDGDAGPFVGSKPPSRRRSSHHTQHKGAAFIEAANGTAPPDSDDERRQSMIAADKEVDGLNTMVDDKRHQSIDPQEVALAKVRGESFEYASHYGGGDKEFESVAAAERAPLAGHSGAERGVDNDIGAQREEHRTPRRPSRNGSTMQQGTYIKPLPSSEKKNIRRYSRTSEDGSVEVWEEGSMSLLEATAQKDIPTINRLLTMFPKSAKSVDYKGQTALHLACQIGSLELVELLTGYNMFVDAQDSSGKTALHFCRNPEIVCLLCDEEADPNLADYSGLVPLHEYTQSENVDCVRAIVAYGADPTIPEPNFLRTSIHIAADSGCFEILSILLLESQVSISVDQRDVDGMTALHLAATCDRDDSGQLKIFMLLLEKGANPIGSNDRGITPLHLICANRTLSRLSIAEPIAEMLINLEADPNCQDVDGCTPLIVACAYREWSLCRMLLQAGGDLNVPCSMTSIFLQAGDMRISFSKDKQDIKTSALIGELDCTASDLMPRAPRYALFGCITVPQTRIQGAKRDRCMNCASSFDSGSMFQFSSGKHHCRHCLRVVCQACSPHEVPRAQMPDFIQETCNESSMRICKVCYTVLIEKKDFDPSRKSGDASDSSPRGNGSSWF